MRRFFGAMGSISRITIESEAQPEAFIVTVAEVLSWKAEAFQMIDGKLENLLAVTSGGGKTVGELST